ncbi:MAG: restriction endonuclease subunit S [Proteobacteria bacterium]|nr:restriction endonuclease subunit S [Pseudomonadota bacterium]MBU0968680.1 restriction endonuclease subunit S [Pseudomonadota bacterium]
MNAQTFLENFGHIANAPNGVLKLREMILTLAMQGQLVKQSSEDVPANALLEEIETVQRRLVKARKIKSPQKLIEIAEEEKRYVLPTGWAWVRFGNIAQHNSGKTLDKRRNTGHPRDYITTSNLYWGTFELGELRQMLIRDEELERCTARKGDLLICEGGEAGRAAVWPYDYEVSFQNHVHRCRFYTGIDPYFAYRFFEKLNATGEINQYRKGVGISNMSGKTLASIVFPLPPFEEQKRIVAKVDELMALCDKLEAQQQKRERRFPVLSRALHARLAESPTPTNLKAIFEGTEIVSPEDLRKTILSLAVQGKLVGHDGSDGNANELIYVKHKLPPGFKRRRKILKKSIVNFPSSLFPELPASWIYKSIQELYDLNVIVDYADGNHGSLYPRKADFGNSGITFVSAKDINNGCVQWSECPKLNEKKANQLSKGWAEGGDVLLTHNATVGRVAKVENTVGRFLLGTSVTYYRLNTKVLDQNYFYYVLCSPIWQDQLGAIMEQTTRNQVSIQKQAFFRIPIPPLKEQIRIARKVDQIIALIGQVEEQQKQIKVIAKSFAQAAVTAITGTQVKEQEKMKAPKTELVTKLLVGKKPRPNDKSPLANIITKHKGELSAKTLWQQSDFNKIDEFYQQLKTEMANGWIVEPEKGAMKAVESI